MDSRHPNFVHRSNRRSGLLKIVAAWAVLFLATQNASAQNAPPAPNQDVVKAAQLTEAQVAAVKAYADHWTAVFCDPKSNPDDIEKARVELIRPLDGSNAMVASPHFRLSYANAVVPGVDCALNGENLHASSNAMRVIAQLGTEKALAALLSHVDTQDEKSWQRRLRAASGCQVMLKSAGLPPKKVVDAAKKLADAAGRELSNDVLFQQLSAINAADQPGVAPNDLRPEDRRKIRQLLVAAVSAIANRPPPAPDATSKPPVAALTGAILNLQSAFRKGTLEPVESAELGRQLGPALGKMLSLASAQWQPGHADNDSRRLYSTMVAASEALLNFIDTAVRPGKTQPPSKLRDLWNTGSKESFDADLKPWLDIVAKAPYGQN